MAQSPKRRQNRKLVSGAPWPGQLRCKAARPNGRAQSRAEAKPKACRLQPVVGQRIEVSAMYLVEGRTHASIWQAERQACFQARFHK